jgi:N-acetylneuraminic acid mutarotase
MNELLFNVEPGNKHDSQQISSSNTTIDNGEIGDQVIKKHITGLLSNLNELRNDGLLFDFRIHVGNKILKVHRVVLAASSDYFKAMFAHDSKELEAGQVYLQNIDANAVEAIINYIYTCKVDLNNENIESILLAASILQVKAVQDACVHFIENQIDASNCLGVAVLSERCGLNELNSKALSYCYANFDQVVGEKEFLSLDASMLARIISADELQISHEAHVFYYVIRWIKADQDKRIAELSKLMRHVRFGTIEPKVLVALSEVDLIRTSIECRDMIDTARNYLLCKNDPQEQERLVTKLMTTPRDARQRIYAVGGWTDEFTPIASAEVYDPIYDIWTEIRPMTQKRCGAGLTSLGNSIYAVGGHNGIKYLNTVERFDFIQRKWSKDVAAMNHERSSVGVVSLGGFIYAIGGQTQQTQHTQQILQTQGSNALDVVEKYNPALDTWEICACMHEKRLGMGVAVYDGCIYVMGGSDSGNNILNTVEKYYPEANKWKYVSPMATARKHLGSCKCGDLIFAVGGTNSTGELDSAEVYSPDINKWTEIPKMHKKRCGIGLVELSGRVYAIGGRNQEASSYEVEAYDPTSRTWKRKRAMKHSRLGGGMTVYPEDNERYRLEF